MTLPSRRHGAIIQIPLLNPNCQARLIRLCSPIGDGFSLVKDFGFVQQIGGHYLARWLQPFRVWPGWAVNNQPVKQEVCQLLFGKTARHR